MSLTLALAVVGALLLIGLVAHGAWQQRRARPPGAVGRTAAAPTVGVPTGPATGASPSAGMVREAPPADGPRIEPTLDGLLEPAEEAHAAEGPAVAEGVAFAAPAAEGPAFTAPPRARPVALPVDPLIDAIATVTVEAPVAGETALAHLPGSRRAGSKPFAVEGLGSESGTWEAVQPGRHYSEFQCGIQLANRGGALNEIEYSEFVQKMQAFADTLGAVADFPDMLEVVSRAKELDAFASQNDAQLAMRLRPQGSAWSTGYVQQQAARCGFVAGALPGRLVLPGAVEHEPPVLVLHFDAQAALSELPSQAVVGELALEFDVAQTPRDAEPYATWLDAGRALAEALEALVTDNQGQPMAISALDGTERELSELYDRLEEHGLPAGSAAARRLFS